MHAIMLRPLFVRTPSSRTIRRIIPDNDERNMVILGPTGERASIVYCVFYLKYAIFITLSHAACRAPVYMPQIRPAIYVIRVIISSFFFNFNTALIRHVQKSLDRERILLRKSRVCITGKFRCVLIAETFLAKTRSYKVSMDEEIREN